METTWRAWVTVGRVSKAARRLLRASKVAGWDLGGGGVKNVAGSNGPA